MEANKDKGTTVGFSNSNFWYRANFGWVIPEGLFYTKNKAACDEYIENENKIEDNDKLWSKVIDRFGGIDNYADASDRQDYIETLITELKKQFTITRKQP